MAILNFTKFFSDYATETTCHGFKEIETSKRLAWKIFWIILVCAGIVIAAYLIYLGICNFLNNPVITTMTEQDLASFTLPFLYCPSRWLDKNQILARKINANYLAYTLSHLCSFENKDEMNTWKFNDIYGPNSDLDVTQMNETQKNYPQFLREQNVSTVFDLLLAISVNQLGTYINIRVRTNGYAIKVDNNGEERGFSLDIYDVNPKIVQISRVMSSSGMCFYATLPVDLDVEQMMKVTNTDGTVKLATSLPIMDKVYFHVKVEPPHGYGIAKQDLNKDPTTYSAPVVYTDYFYVGNQAQAFIPDTTQGKPVEIGLQIYQVTDVTTYSRLNLASRPCRPTPTKFGGPYLKHECLQECFTITKRECRPLGLNVSGEQGDHPTCTYRSPADKGNLTEEEVRNFEDCYTNCAHPCQEMKVSLTQSPGSTRRQASATLTDTGLNRPRREQNMLPGECQSFFKLLKILMLPESVEQCFYQKERPPVKCFQAYINSQTFVPKQCREAIKYQWFGQWKRGQYARTNFLDDKVIVRPNIPQTEFGPLSNLTLNKLNQVDVDERCVLFQNISKANGSFPSSCTWDDIAVAMAFYEGWENNQSSIAISSVSADCAADYASMHKNEDVATNFNSDQVDDVAQVRRKREYTTSKYELFLEVFRNLKSCEESPSFTWDSLLGIIGGQLGLWIGASILSFFQLMYYFCTSFANPHQSTSMTTDNNLKINAL